MRANRALDAVIAVLFAVPLTAIAAPAAAQPAIDPAQVSHVRLGDVRYDRIGPNSWVETARDGKKTAYVETRQSSGVRLSAGSPRRTTLVDLDFAARTSSAGYIEMTSESPPVGRGAIGAGPAIDEYWGDCSSAATLVGKCTCDLRALKPLQGVAGLGEVAKKTRDVSEEFAAERNAQEKDPIKVVRGFGDRLYVVDHHHGALAFLKAGHSTGTCEILQPPKPLSMSDEAVFWQQLDENRWIRLRNSIGEPLRPDELPASLERMPDDPYRTLAWMVRKADGYCRALMLPAPPPFAEFAWADWMRQRADLPFDDVRRATDPALWSMRKKEREARQRKVLDTAIAAVRSQAAKDANLPGYRGQVAVAVCNPSGGD